MTAGAALALPFSVLPRAAQASTPTLAVPAPTGRHRVGTRLLHLIDRGRPDPLAPDSRARELIVRLFYPTAAGGRPDATYLSPTLSSVLTEQINALAGIDLPLDILTFRTHGRVDAPIAAAACHRAVLFSPGLGTNAAIYTALMEDLASRGFVVAGLDHTFDAVVEFPGGRVQPPAENVPFEQMLAVRTADMRFVLDHLSGSMELGGVAAVGHSMGSMTAIQAILADRRIGAGVVLDGNPMGQGSVDRPLMMLGNPSHRRAADPDWAGFYDRLRGPRLHLVVDGMEHLDLSDIAAFKMVVDLGSVFEVGPIDGLRAIAVTRAYVAAWLEFGLGGRSHPILRREPKRFPEVDFQP